MWKKLKAVALATVAGVLALCSGLASAAYSVPTYISDSITSAGDAFTAIFALVSVGIMAVVLAKGGFKMVVSWIGQFFKK